MRECDILISLLGYCAAVIIAGVLYGAMAVLLVFFGASCVAFCIALIVDDDYEDVPDHDSCVGCKHDSKGRLRIYLHGHNQVGKHWKWGKKKNGI